MRKFLVNVNGEAFTVEVEEIGAHEPATQNAAEASAALAQPKSANAKVSLNTHVAGGQANAVNAAQAQNANAAQAAAAPKQGSDAAYKPAAQTPHAPAPAKPIQAPAGSVNISAPMPGTIIKVNVTAGQSVKKGTILAVLEAMKMENEIIAPHEGTVISVNIVKGQQVNSGEVMISLN